MIRKLTPRSKKLIKEAFELENINPYDDDYDLYCVTSHIEKCLKYQKEMDVSHIGTTLDVIWAIEEMKKQKLF